MERLTTIIEQKNKNNMTKIIIIWQNVRYDITKINFNLKSKYKNGLNQ